MFTLTRVCKLRGFIRGHVVPTPELREGRGTERRGISCGHPAPSILHWGSRAHLRKLTTSRRPRNASGKSSLGKAERVGAFLSSRTRVIDSRLILKSQMSSYAASEDSESSAFFTVVVGSLQPCSLWGPPTCLQCSAYNPIVPWPGSVSGDGLGHVTGGKDGCQDHSLNPSASLRPHPSINELTVEKDS